jgi:hypothetical protein
MGAFIERFSYSCVYLQARDRLAGPLFAAILTFDHTSGESPKRVSRFYQMSEYFGGESVGK